MAAAVEAAVGDRLVAGVITAHEAPTRRWIAVPPAHPHPTADSELAGRAALALADGASDDHGMLLLCLSGGASAMLAVPADGLSIDDKAATTHALLRAGVDIAAVNLVRRHLSAIKGGQLAARAGRSTTLAISDVCTPVEDDPVVIGSGPTVGDPTTFSQALALLDGCGLRAAVPSAVVAHLESGARGQVAGPVPPGDPRLADSTYIVVASRRDAMRQAARAAAALGYHVHVEPAPIVGEARIAGLQVVTAAARLPRPACWISSGETTVFVRGPGRGGRNQELGLSAARALAALGPAALVSIGTDGRDGPTDAAGVMVDDTYLENLGPDAAARVEQALADNDVYPLLEATGALVKTGASGTNVGDLQVLLLPTAPSVG